MPTTIYDDIFNDAVKRGIVDKNIFGARKWFREMAQNVGNANPATLMATSAKNYHWATSRSALTGNNVGQMFLFNYDPKLKRELPYYDRYPLIFPISIESDSFLGLNMHYLSPRLRAVFMDSLYSVRNNDKYDSTTKLNLTYGILKSASKFRYFKPCIKKYLLSHTRSQFMLVPSKAWEICLFLPLGRFEKANESKVWKDSQNMVK